MKVLCPLRGGAEIEPLVQAGARELYAGVESSVLFGDAASASPFINCRPWPGSNFETEASLVEGLATAERLGVGVYLAFNWYAYRTFELEAILAFLGRHQNIAGAIVADLTLLARVREAYPKIRLVVSSVAHAGNSGSVAFFRDLGAQQFVLPRHLTLKEIETIIENHPQAEFEVFIKNQDCFFVQGRCYFTHDVVDGSVPYRCYSVRRYIPSRDLTAPEMEGLQKHVTHFFNNCGACALHDLHRIGVHAVKLVGRDLPLEERCKDMSFIHQSIASLSLEREAFGERVRALHESIYQKSCDRDCMY